MKYPRGKLRVSEYSDENVFPKGVTPECFNGGSRSQTSPGFPLKACGNECARDGATSTR